MKRRTFLKRAMAMGAGAALATSSLAKIAAGSASAPPTAAPFADDEPLVEFVQPPMQFNTAPAGLFDQAIASTGHYSSMYFPGHTHTINLGRFGGPDDHDMGALRLRTAREFSLPLGRVDEMTDAELLLRAETMHIE